MKVADSSSSGKSTLQNELLGDLGNEFDSLPDNTEETPLNELGGLLQTTYNEGLESRHLRLSRRCSRRRCLKASTGRGEEAHGGPLGP
jgi:3-oxoacyl-ACP reductase-like protein